MSSIVQGNTRRLVAVVVVLVLAAAGAVFAFGGGMPNMSGGSSGAGHAKVAAGGFEFAYPAGWSKIAHGDLPTEAVRNADAAGSVVAGLCTAKVQGAGCGAPVDVSYVLFQQGEAFPALASLETSLDGSLSSQFTGFKKSGAELRSTADGLRYLEYQFSFTKDGVKQHELVAAYRHEGKGLLVVATGPAADFATQRDNLRHMLDGAVQGAAH